MNFRLSDDSPKTLAEEELRSPPRTARAKKPTGDDTPSGMQETGVKTDASTMIKIMGHHAILCLNRLTLNLAHHIMLEHVH